jgi:hypothetical protein
LSIFRQEARSGTDHSWAVRECRSEYCCAALRVNKIALDGPSIQPQSFYCSATKEQARPAIVLTAAYLATRRGGNRNDGDQRNSFGNGRLWVEAGFRDAGYVRSDAAQRRLAALAHRGRERIKRKSRDPSVALKLTSRLT